MFCFKAKRSEAFFGNFIQISKWQLFLVLFLPVLDLYHAFCFFVIWNVLSQSVIVRAFYFDWNMSSKIEIDHIPNFRRPKFFREEVISQNNLKIPKILSRNAKLDKHKQHTNTMGAYTNGVKANSNFLNSYYFAKIYKFLQRRCREKLEKILKEQLIVVIRPLRLWNLTPHYLPRVGPIDLFHQCHPIAESTSESSFDNWPKFADFLVEVWRKILEKNWEK